MANYKYRELQDIFIELTAKLRDLDLENPEESNLVRLAYLKTSAPFQEITDGVSYIWINYSDTDTNKQVLEEYIDTENDNLILKRSQLRKLDVHWTFYGNEDVQDIAYEFRNKIFSYQAKEILDKYDIKLILDVPEEVLLFEQENNYWWARVELIVSYYLTSSINEKVNTYESANIKFISENEKLNREINVKEMR